jgi:aryl-alcohol dehydrogenase-like predicted oxidoreductase
MASDHVLVPRRELGKSGISVPIIGMGLWAAGGDYWGPTDDRDSLNAIDAALNLGVNFFDTADVYGGGHSERLLGQAMKSRRDRFIVATKIGWFGFDDNARRSAYSTVDLLVAGVEESLERLQTDYIDLIQCHIDFRDPTMEVFLEGFQKLQKTGKVRAYGLSTSDLAYIKEFCADGNCAAVQVDYSILNRTPEKEIFPYCRAHKIGIVVRGPLAMGTLTGKFRPEMRFPEGDFRRRWHNDVDEYRLFLDDLTKVEQLRPLAVGKTLSQLALQFVTATPEVTVAIPGAKNPSQLQDNMLAALLPPLTDHDFRIINQIVPPGGGRKIWPA